MKRILSKKKYIFTKISTYTNDGGVGLREGDLLKGTRGGDDLGDGERDLDLDLLTLLGDLDLEWDLLGDLEGDLWRDLGGVL